MRSGLTATGPNPLTSSCSPPPITGGTTDQQNAAWAVRFALKDPHSDIRLQIIVLEAELDATPATADEDRIRLHHALAGDYDQLGGYPHALRHGTEELTCRRRRRPETARVIPAGIADEIPYRCTVLNYCTAER